VRDWWGDFMIPYAPIDTLKPVAASIWIVDGSIIRFGAGPFRAPFTTRMTVIRLNDGGLWVHSPVDAGEALFAAVEALGPVRFLIAPNPIHYWWIPQWKARFPEAEFHAVETLKARAKRALPDFRAFSGDAPTRWSGTIDQLLVEDGWFREAVFFHKKSRTLILADLIENFELSHVHGRFLRLLLRLGGVLDPDGKMPRDMRFAFRRHREGLKRAVEHMLAWNPERIILAHGRWYDRDGVAELKRAFRWLL
jgi:hypothetical protein